MPIFALMRYSGYMLLAWMRRHCGALFYVAVWLLSLVYFSWRMFLKGDGSGHTLAFALLLLTYSLLALLFLIWPAWLRSSWLLQRRFLLAGVLVGCLTLYFIEVRHDGVVEAILNDDQSFSTMRVWQHGEPKVVPEAEVKWEDESKNFAMAQNLERYGALSYVKLYKPETITWGIYRAHPPLFTVTLSKISALANTFGLYPPVGMRLFSFLCMLVNALLVYLIYRRFVGDTGGLWVSVVFLCIPYFFYYFGCRAQNDQFTTLWALLFFLFGLRTMESGSWRFSIAAGLFLAAGFWTKYTTLLALASVGLVYLVYNPKALSVKRRGLHLLAQASIGIGLLFIWFWIIYGTPVGEAQWGRWIAKELGRVVDPTQLGRAMSGGRGGIREMLAFFPVDLGVPQFLLLCLASLVGLRALLQKRAWQPLPLILVSWLGVYLAAAMLVIPKLNYVLPAAPALACAIYLGANLPFRDSDESLKSSLLVLCLLSFFVKIGIWAIEI